MTANNLRWPLAYDNPFVFINCPFKTAGNCKSIVLQDKTDDGVTVPVVVTGNRKNRRKYILK
jgi:hypothetical protein